MAGLKFFWRRLLPDTLFGRLALLLFLVLLSSHLLSVAFMLALISPPFGPSDSMPHGWTPPQGPPFPPLPWAQGATTPPIKESFGLFADIAIRLTGLMLAAWVGAQWISDPMSRLARAARDLGKDINSPPIPEQGAYECRETIRVFNLMQAQIRHQLGQRDLFLAAVSHDLRTPLTRLALRAESLNYAQDRLRFGKDISEMEAMIRATLDYLRGAADSEPWVSLDIGSLLDSLAHDYEDSGYNVKVVGGLRALPLLVQASSLRRCIANVVENAVRYGDCARITLLDTTEAVHITISDDGPGIPAEELDKVLAPFYRLESSRNRNSGGVGLGLASARDIAQRHGGQLKLENAQGGGLLAMVTLSRHASVPNR